VQFTDLDDSTHIEILGSQFDNGDFLEVTVDGAPILVSAAIASRISAELHGNTPDGDYVIGVSTGPKEKQNADHNLTVAPLVAISVACIDWFLTTGDGHHMAFWIIRFSALNTTAFWRSKMRGATAKREPPRPKVGGCQFLCIRDSLPAFDHPLGSHETPEDRTRAFDADQRISLDGPSRSAPTA